MTKDHPTQSIANAYPAQSIANAFIKITHSRKKPLTNVQVQNLVYLAHGWHLALTETPLIKEPIWAWNFGPVIRPLYEALQKYGSGTMDDLIPGYPLPDDQTFATKLINRILEVYGHLPGSKLLAIANITLTAFDFEIINNKLICKRFKKWRKQD
jgi:uncharacterized phage-associated protein